MTGKHDTTAVAGSRLEEPATLWLNEEWDTARTRELWAMFHPDLEQARAWAVFQDLAEAIRLRDGVGEGRIHWAKVCPKLTGIDRSADAYDIACGLVEDATHLLLHGRPR